VEVFKINLSRIAKIQDYDQRKRIMMLLHKFEREENKDKVVDRYIKWFDREKLNDEKWRK
jgi:hypothetical protein